MTDAAESELDPHGEQPGSTVGPYTLREAIGEGGFGTVWLADQKEPFARRVALKILKLGMDSKEVLARFEQERQALAVMDHPHIARVYDAGLTVTGRPYFAMEYVKGASITDYCDRARLTLAQRLELFASVCDAVQHAHMKGILHRDLKPSNILVSAPDSASAREKVDESSKPVVKVIDFGLAKALSGPLTDKSIYTERGRLLGTPAYMSPEQAEMAETDVDTRSDVYALGVILYELLAGALPLDPKLLRSAGYAELLRTIREVDPPRPSVKLSSLGADDSQKIAAARREALGELTAHLRGELEWIPLKAMRKDRAERYRSASELGDDIANYLEHRPLIAGPESAAYKLRKFGRRNRAGVAAGAVVLLALVLGLAGTIWQARRAGRELARANEVKRLVTDMLGRVGPEEAKGKDITLLKGILDDTAERLFKDEVKDELVAAELHHVIGEVYLSLARYSEGEQHLKVAVEIRTRVLGEEHAETLSSMWLLAIAYGDQTRYVEAERMHRKVLKLRSRLLGDEHGDTLASMRVLASVLMKQNRYDEALTLMLRAYETACRVLAEGETQRLGCMNDLALIYQNLGRIDEAEQLYLKMLEICTRVLGEENFGARISMHNLGCLYRDVGRHLEAEAMLVRALELDRRILGDEHPGTLVDITNLATVYTEQGRYDEAERLLRQALEAARRVLGEEVEITLGTKYDLAELLRRSGRYDEAERLFESTMEASRRVFGKENELTLRPQAYQAVLYRNVGRHAEAEALTLQTLEAWKRLMGDDHPETLRTITNLGLLYVSMGRFDEAAALFEARMPSIRRVLGMRRHETWDALRGLIDAYLGRSEANRARALCVELRDGLRPLVIDPKSSAKPLWTLAWVLTREVDGVQDPTTALVLAQRAADAAEAQGEGERWTFLDVLARAQHLSSNSASAIETQRRALALLPSGHPKRADYEERLTVYEAAPSKVDAGVKK